MNEIWWAHIWEGIFSRGRVGLIIGILRYVLIEPFTIECRKLFVFAHSR